MMISHPNRRRQSSAENYYIDYRYIPGSLGTGSSLDNGAVMREARRTRSAADRRVRNLQADARIQWVQLIGRHANMATSNHGGPAG